MISIRYFSINILLKIMKTQLAILYMILLALIPATHCYADHNKQVGYYMSIKSTEANIRTGPSIRYPIKFVFVNKNEPVKVISEFEHWRKIYDIDGENGWIHESMLSKRNTAIVIGNQNRILYKTPSFKIQIASIEPKVRVKIKQCNEQNCKIQVEDIEGWIEKEYLWGGTDTATK